MHKVVVGIFQSQQDAVRAAERCRESGFDPQQVTIISPDDAFPDYVHGSELGIATISRSAARASTVLPAICAAIGFFFGLVFWQVIPADYNHLVVLGGVFGMIYGAALGVALDYMFGGMWRRSRERRREVEGGSRPLTLVAVHTQELEETFTAERIFDKSGAVEIDTRAA